MDNCSGPPDVASPDPCVASRTILGDGDLQIVVLTSTLSDFNFGLPDCVAPAEVAGVRFHADRETLAWGGLSGPGVRYDVARGVARQWPVGTGMNEACFATGVTGSSLAEPQRPPAGLAYWYLVRARSACAAGSYGAQSNGTPRISNACSWQ